MQPEFVDQEQPSTSGEVREIPERFQELFQKQILKIFSKLKSFLSSFLALIQDKYVVSKLQALIGETPVESQPKIWVNQVKNKFKSGRELRMSAQIGYYDMDYIILDLGSDVNIMTQRTWESMGNPCLEWSPI